MRRKISKFILLCNALVLLAAAQGGPSSDWEHIPLVKDLMITLAARERMYDEFLKLQASARLSSMDQSDFQAYIDRLDLRIAVQCHEVLEQFPDLQPGELPCTPANPPPGLPDAAARQTPDQVLATLDAELAEGLAEFDDMLLSEQERVAAKAPRGGGGANGGGWAGREGDEAQGHGEGGGDQGQGGEQRENQGDARKGGQPPAEGPGAGERAGRRTPEDDPDGSKDDVVARQLREAAEKETDPELKRKLWDEYRRYKASIH